MKYVKKPIPVEAEQWFPKERPVATYAPSKDLAWNGQVYKNPNSPTGYSIETLEREVSVTPGDFIITGIEGERYPIKPHIFRKTYDPVEETAANPQPVGTEIKPTPKVHKLPNMRRITG